MLILVFALHGNPAMNFLRIPALIVCLVMLVALPMSVHNQAFVMASLLVSPLKTVRLFVSQLVLPIHCVLGTPLMPPLTTVK